MNRQINSLLLILAFYVGLLLGFLRSERPLFPDPPALAPVKLEKELRPKPPPKELTVKVSIERSPDPIRKPSLEKKRPKVIAKVYRVDNSLVRSGMALVGQKGEHLGSFPAITANYRVNLGFESYVKSLQSLGARFFIRDRWRKKLVGEVDFHTLYLSPIRHLNGLSPRSRIISSELAANQYIELANVMFGKGDYQMILLLPLQIDAALTAGMEKALRQAGYDVRNFISLQARYENDSRGLWLVVVKGTHRTLDRIPLRVRFNLDHLHQRQGHET
jgi:hypothetical protein